MTEPMPSASPKKREVRTVLIHLNVEVRVDADATDDQAIACAIESVTDRRDVSPAQEPDEGRAVRMSPAIEPTVSVGPCAKPGCGALVRVDGWCYGCGTFICHEHSTLDAAGSGHDVSEHWPQTLPFKTCSCGRIFESPADFRQLPLHAVSVTLDGGVDETLEYRNCTCRSTLAILCRREARLTCDLKLGDVAWFCSDGDGDPTKGAKRAVIWPLRCGDGSAHPYFVADAAWVIAIPIDPQPTEDPTDG